MSQRQSVGAGHRTALLVLDMQVDFLAATGRFPVAADQVGDVISRVNRLLAEAADRGWTPAVIVNQYSAWDPFNLFRNGAAISGTSGAALDPRIEAGHAPRFSKRAADAFSNPTLVDHLRTCDIGQVIIAGVYAEACVTGTALGAARRGLAPIVVADAVAGRSDGKRAAALDALRAKGVSVASSEHLFAVN